MSRIHIYRDRRDWRAECDAHDWYVTTYTQPAAYEAAAGHACLHHPSGNNAAAVYDHLVNGCSHPACDPSRSAFGYHLFAVARGDQ